MSYWALHRGFSMPQKKISAAKYTARMMIGFFLAPLDSVYSLLKGMFYFLLDPLNYVYKDRVPGDRAGRDFFATFALSRIAAVFVVGACILGFLGIVHPLLPFVTPISPDAMISSVDSFNTIVKAAFITTFWTLSARTLGAFIGAIPDLIYHRFLNENLYKNSMGFDCTDKGCSTISNMVMRKGLTMAAKAAFIGEAASYKLEVRESVKGNGFFEHLPTCSQVSTNNTQSPSLPEPYNSISMPADGDNLANSEPRSSVHSPESRF